MVKIYIQATENIFIATHDQWKEIEDFDIGKKRWRILSNSDLKPMF